MNALSHTENDLRTDNDIVSLQNNIYGIENYPKSANYPLTESHPKSALAEIHNAVNSVVFAKRKQTRILKLEEKIEKITVDKVHSIVHTPHSDGSITHEENFQERVSIEKRVKETLVALMNEKSAAQFPRGFIAADNVHGNEINNNELNKNLKLNNNSLKSNNQLNAEPYSQVIDAEFTDNAADAYGCNKSSAQKNSNYVPLLSLF